MRENCVCVCVCVSLSLSLSLSLCVKRKPEFQLSSEGLHFCVE